MSPTYSICKDHGYLTGEQYTCPHCGAATEVYSRITGYYRPVQNFNDGKAQEFKDRRVYDIANSQLKKEDRVIDHAHCDCHKAEKAETVVDADTKFLLFAAGTSVAHFIPETLEGFAVPGFLDGHIPEGYFVAFFLVKTARHHNHFRADVATISAAFAGI